MNPHDTPGLLKDFLLTCSSLMVFCSLAIMLASSSRRPLRLLISPSFLRTSSSRSRLTLSRSSTVSWVILRSPSTFLLALSTSPRTFFSLSRASSSYGERYLQIKQSFTQQEQMTTLDFKSEVLSIQRCLESNLLLMA